MKCVALTGGIGSGKSTVGRLLRVLGIPVFEADQEARHIMAEDPLVRRALIDRFGEAVFGPHGLDRKYLAAQVFGRPDALADVNAIVHPAVRKAFRAWSLDQEAPYVIMEAAIVAETGSHSAFDAIVVVSAPEPVRIQRVMERDGVGEADVLARMRSQTSEEERIKIADHVVINDGTSLVIPQVLTIHEALK